MSTEKPLTILYFAWVREKIGAAEEGMPLPGGVRTVAALIEHLAGRDAAHAAAFGHRKSVRCAVNQEFAPVTTELHPGDEVAFFPPVTGG
jgi:molybdopterin synthase sulfur carrier subunit